MLTQERLHEVLDYNSDTGLFKWRVAMNSMVAAGSEAGSFDAGGYLQIGIDGKNYKTHRLAILYTDGYLPENSIDHVNRVRSDNRRANLREASMQCQRRNCGMLRNNTSGVKGVAWHKQMGKWLSFISLDGKKKHLGFHYTIIEAACHRYAAEQCLGFSDCDTHSSAKKYIDTIINTPEGG